MNEINQLDWNMIGIFLIRCKRVEDTTQLRNQARQNRGIERGSFRPPNNALVFCLFF